MTAVLTTLPRRSRPPCAGRRPRPAIASSRGVVGGPFDEVHEVAGSDVLVRPPRETPRGEGGGRGVLLVERALLRDDHGTRIGCREVRHAVLPRGADDHGAARQQRPRIVDARGVVVSDGADVPSPMREQPSGLVADGGRQDAAQQQHAPLLPRGCHGAPVEARDPSRPRHTVEMGRESRRGHGAVRPRRDDAVGEVVGEHVRGVGAFARLRHRDRPQPQQAGEGDDLGAHVDDERFEPPLRGGRRDRRQPGAVSRVAPRRPVQTPAHRRVAVPRIDRSSLGALERVGIRGELDPLDVGAESGRPRHRRERDDGGAQVRLHGEEPRDMAEAVVVDVPADHHDTAGTRRAATGWAVWARTRSTSR